MFHIAFSTLDLDLLSSYLLFNFKNNDQGISLAPWCLPCTIPFHCLELPWLNMDLAAFVPIYSPVYYLGKYVYSYINTFYPRKVSGEVREAGCQHSEGAREMRVAFTVQPQGRVSCLKVTCANSEHFCSFYPPFGHGLLIMLIRKTLGCRGDWQEWQDKHSPPPFF